MAKHTTIEALFSEIEFVSEDILRKEIAKFAVEEKKKNIQEKVYDRSEPDMYIRTMELLNSVISQYLDNKSSKTKKILSVFNDTSRTFMPSGHRSVVDNRMHNRDIEIWMNYGTNSPIYSHLPSYFYEKTLIEIEENLKKEYILAFRKRGYKAS